MGLSDALDSGYQDPNAAPPPDFSSPPAKDLPSQYISTPDQTTSTPAALNYSPAGGGYTPATEPTPPSAPQGMGAYGAGAGGAAPPQSGGLSPDMQARIANYRAPARPAGYTPTTETVKSSPVDPAQAASLSELEQAKLEQAQAQQGYANAAGKVMAPLVDQQAKERAAFQANVKSSLDEHVHKIQTLTDSASQAAREEPESFWGKTPGTVIARSLAMAAMAFGNTLTGKGPDPVAYMNSMIAENAAKQKAKVDAAKGDLDRETNLYAVMKQKFGDDESALTATQMLQKQAVLDQLDESFQKPTAARVTWGTAPDKTAENPFDSLPPTVRLNLANQRLALAQSIYEDRAKLFDKHASSIEASQAYHAASGGGSADPLEQLKRVAAGEQAAATINTAGRKAAADVAETEAKAAKANTPASQPQVAAYDNALDALGEVRDMVAKGGTLSASETARGQALRSRLVNELARAETGGTRAPSKEEQELISQQLPKDPNAFQWTGADMARVTSTIQGLQRARARAAGTALPNSQGVAAGETVDTP